MSIIDDPDDLSAEQRQLLLDTMRETGRRLRAWKASAAPLLHSVSAQIMSADGPSTLTCGADDRVSLVAMPGAEPIDITALVDAD